jgi:predicted transposase YdaD
MPTAAAKSEEFYQSTAQELQKRSRARAAVWLAKQGRGRKPETSRLHKAGRTLCCRVHKNRCKRQNSKMPFTKTLENKRKHKKTRATRE